jgi:hypothetical protein
MCVTASPNITLPKYVHSENAPSPNSSRCGNIRLLLVLAARTHDWTAYANDDG